MVHQVAKVLRRPRSTSARRTRASVSDALAGRVRVAVDASIKAFHDAAGDRKRLFDLEWESANDTLGDIEEAADILHGFASWATSARPHPAPAKVRTKLTELTEVLAKLRPRVTNFARLSEYVVRLSELRIAVAAYFARPRNAR